MPQCERAQSISGRPEGPYRAVESADALVTQDFEDVDTLDKLFVHAVKRFSKAPCLGTREVLSEEEEKQPNGKIFKKVNEFTDLIRYQFNQLKTVKNISASWYRNACVFVCSWSWGTTAGRPMKRSIKHWNILAVVWQLWASSHVIPLPSFVRHGQNGWSQHRPASDATSHVMQSHYFYSKWV